VLPFHTVVGAAKKSSTFRDNKFSTTIVTSLMSISHCKDRLPDRGVKMASDTVVLDVSRDWATACDVQERFMQHSGPRVDTLSYSARCRQVRALGGDFYDFMPLPHSRLALAVGDASGKGLAAALMISNVQSSLRTAASLTGNDGPAVLTAVNRQVYASSLEDRFATLFYGVFDGATRRLQYVNAGHNPPMVIRRDSSIIWLRAGGVPVGIFPNSTYEPGAVQLNPGDLILAYTDGVIEAVNPAGDEWGAEGLRKAAAEKEAQCADDIVHAIFTSMDEFSRGCQTDDATVAVVRVH
jgi:sigma-B regulation protein RsbU (phosphoserine phosphatase)